MKSEKKKNDLRKCVHKHLASDVPIDFISSDKRWKGRWKISVKTSMYVYVYCSQWRRKQSESGGLDVLETLTSEIRIMVMVTYMFKFELNIIAKRYDQIKFNHTFINNNTRHNCNIHCSVVN